MHSGYEIPGIQQHPQAPDNTCAPVMLSINQTTHILDQIHTLPTTQQLFLDQHHFLPPHHHFLSGSGGANTPYFPVNFKLGLNEGNSDYKNDGTGINEGNGGDAALLRGSEQQQHQYHVPEDARHSSLGMLHCWQNQQDSAIKQQPFWEPLPAEVSNENSEIVDRQEHLEMNQKEAPANCLDSKRRVHFGELEAIYKRLGASEVNQTGPSDQEIHPPVHHSFGLDHGSEASIGEEASESVKIAGKKRKKKKKKKEKEREEGGHHHMISPVMEFFGDLVKKVMDHQENLHKKFAQVIERLDEERRAREEVWRNQEMVHFEQEAAARARERALAQSREAMIVSYLEKITGQRINLPAMNPPGVASTSTSDDFPGHDKA